MKKTLSFAVKWFTGILIGIVLTSNFTGICGAPKEKVKKKETQKSTDKKKINLRTPRRGEIDEQNLRPTGLDGKLPKSKEQKASKPKNPKKNH